MKQIILAAMAALTLSGSVANATSDWDIFWGTTVSQGLDPKTNGWDEFFGETLDPQNTGWDDFWYQCQDPDKTTWDCMGTVAAGIGFAVAIPLAAVAVGAASVGIVAGGASAAVVAVPGVTTYIATSAGMFVVAPSATTGLAPLAFTASGGVVFGL